MFNIYCGCYENVHPYTRSTFVFYPVTKFPKAHAKMGLFELLKF